MKTLFFGSVGLAFLTGLTTGILSAEPAEPIKTTLSNALPLSDYEHHSIEQVLTNPTHEKPVKITGEIIRKIECGTYLFRGEDGDIHIKIDTHAIPEQGLPFREATVIKGTVNHREDQLPVIEADQVHYIF
ncbi:hypothetical protein GZ77_17360 [Endozoicomonas montiporae]|uniref:Uncharacterized protein n=2 Tax=Endozoicomonas montiporae TaxID=1027273 RepID=A0A081N1K4_9GAMM|nr:NirD/YgiW/YdeI family stress tolerance protein [Endozoicomonas montiporae]AMO58742.1 hypothetical protein EZMO1_4848 [Endozoicomonas montiporae CL-33]KEQ12327.1 hypothetical protein GZ77_17360 [Endozoicomonas montiporae]